MNGEVENEEIGGVQAYEQPVSSLPQMFCPECRAEYRHGFTRCS
jgi:hypothetical protein